MITSCICICGVAFWTLPSGIIGSGFALKVQQKKREKQFNRLVPAAASLIQNWWRMIVSRHPHFFTATWKIYQIEVKRPNEVSRHSGPSFALNTSDTNNSTLRLRNSSTAYSVPQTFQYDKIRWRKVETINDLSVKQLTAIRMIRVIKYHAAKRKFSQAHKPYNFKVIMDENTQGNMKVMYTLADIQRRLDQTLGLPKMHSVTLSDQEREQLTLHAKVQRLETQLTGLERQTNRVILLLEELYQHQLTEEKVVTIPQIPAVAIETMAEK